MKMQLSDYLLGKKVDEKAIEAYLEKLSDFDPFVLNNDEAKKAFWINMYNGITIYFIIEHQVETSVLDIEGFFSNLKVSIGSHEWSLDDIEHGILRRNGERRNQKPLQFQEGNPKFKLMVEKVDARIHFALNCGGISCPPMAFYSVEEIDAQLDLATDSFLVSGFIVDDEKREIKCSSIFDWYKNDFGAMYLLDPKYCEYQVYLEPYHWTLQ